MRALTSSAVPVTVVDGSSAPPVDRPRRPVGVVEVDAVADVDVEVALVLRPLVDHRQPLLAAGDVGHGVAAVQLVGGVIGEGAARAGGGEHALRARRPRRRPARCPSRGRRPSRRRRARGPRAVVVANTPSWRSATARPFGPRAPIRIGTSIGRAGRAAVGVQHLHPGALPLDDVAAQQPAVGVDVGGHERPRDRPVPHRPPAGEPGAERHRHPPGRQAGQRRRRRGVRHRVAQVGNEHARARARCATSARRPAPATSTRRGSAAACRTATPARSRSPRRA